MTIHAVFPERYEQQFAEKVAALCQQFAPFSLPDIELFPSPPSHYRMRAEFKIWQDKNRAYYAMYKPGVYKQPFKIESFAVGSSLINQLMPPLLEAINSCDILRYKLFQVEFLTTLYGDALITLVYHKPLNDQWQASAQQLKLQLNADIIGRSRKQKIVLGRDYVIEKLTVNNRHYTYQQLEGSFTQPNGRVCEKMLAWALSASQSLTGDLLELYCGNGNFTIPLARHFHRVLATEVSKTAVKSVRYNLNINTITNVEIVRMSSEECSQAINQVRHFRRLQNIDLDSFNFTTVLVDPPRAGLDSHTLDMVKQFDNILYISCNPKTLRANLESIIQSHTIERFAIFDQFPYTHHLECGVFLRRHLNLNKSVES